MTQIIPFESAKLPAEFTARFSNNDLVGSSAGGGFPVISLKGKVFHIQRGDERTLVTKPGEDDPAGSIEVVILKANPNASKNYYKGGYTEGSVDKPLCYSNDGKAPAADAAEPQSKSCAVCAHNQWGSRITENGAKGKSCSDSRRIAIATIDTPADPMLVRVPAASIKPLVEYGKMLASRGLPPQMVVTKIGFDHTVAYPSLTFRPVGVIGDKATLNEVERMSKSEIVHNIVGMEFKGAQDEQTAPTPAPAALPHVAAPEAEAAAATTIAKTTGHGKRVNPQAAADAAIAAAANTAKVAIKTEPKPATAVDTTATMKSEIESLLDGLEFDN